MRYSSTLLAIIAIALWSSLAILSSQITHIPPIFSVGCALCISGMIGLLQLRSWKVPITTFLVGVGGIFGYHFLYFSAFQYAPAIEVSLMNYLWPLLIVLLSPIFLPGYRLKFYHLAGALLGLTGASLIVTGGNFSLDVLNLRGYILAASAAFIWASYSLLTKRLPSFPTGAVGGFCFFSGILSIAIYLLSNGFAVTLPPISSKDIVFLVLLGIGPMGAAFFAWDAALKRGDPRIIGSLSYLTPLLSTALLIILGGKNLTLISALAMGCIVTGAVIGSLDMFLNPGNR